MLLKISLIVAILAGVATLVITHLQVADRVESLKGTLSTTQTELTTAREDADKSKKDAKAAKEDAEKKGKELIDTQARLEVVTGESKAHETRANKFEADYQKTVGALNESTRSLAAWQALGIPVDQVRNSLVELVRVKDANQAMTSTNDVLTRKLSQAQAELAIYREKKQMSPPLPEGLKGRVLLVPRPTTEEPDDWGFVVLDVGSDQGVAERCEMLASREGKLIAKLRVARVTATRSFADPMPGWTGGELRVGDVVIPASR